MAHMKKEARSQSRQPFQLELSPRFLALFHSCCQMFITNTSIKGSYQLGSHLSPIQVFFFPSAKSRPIPSTGKFTRSLWIRHHQSRFESRFKAFLVKPKIYCRGSRKRISSADKSLTKELAHRVECSRTKLCQCKDFLASQAVDRVFCSLKSDEGMWRVQRLLDEC